MHSGIVLHCGGDVSLHGRVQIREHDLRLRWLAQSEELGQGLYGSIVGKPNQGRMIQIVHRPRARGAQGLREREGSGSARAQGARGLGEREAWGARGLRGLGSVCMGSCQEYVSFHPPPCLKKLEEAPPARTQEAPPS